TTSASTTAILVSGSSPVGTPSRGGSSQVPTSSHTVTGQPRPSSQSIAEHGGQHLPAAGGLSAHAPQSSSSRYVTTYDADNGSDSDSIQGEWNKFLVKICYPCGRYDDT
ncbi:hypothetical protein K503DRAFT_773817, partial [Rhizopogon vinicolor AM-OR11-026]